MMTKKAFTLIEIMVVVLIVGILAAILIPISSARIDSAKWAEANAVAGTIKSAVSTHFAETKERITGSLDDQAVQKALGFTASDLTCTYFVPGDFNIDSVDNNGHDQIKITGSQPNAPKGSKTLESDGTWQ